MPSRKPEILVTLANPYGALLSEPWPCRPVTDALAQRTIEDAIAACRRELGHRDPVTDADVARRVLAGLCMYVEH